MKIFRVSPLTGKERSLDINITPEQYERWERGEFIQNVAPTLSADDREYIISGIGPGEWDLLGAEE